MRIDFASVKEAYTRLRTYVYYDTNNLFLRNQLVQFENPSNSAKRDSPNKLRILYRSFRDKELNTDEVVQNKLNNLVEALNSQTSSGYFEKLYEQIQARFMPKKIKSSAEDPQLISNVRKKELYDIERFTVYIDAPIELHIISVLWIMSHGCKLDASLSEHCFGNRLLLSSGEKLVKGRSLFKPYQRQYQKWRDKSVEIAKKYLDEKNDVLIINLDIRDYYHSVRLTKEDLFFEGIKRGALEDKFFEIHKRFTKLLCGHYKYPYDFGSELNDKVILPIGLLSSFIIGNHYLLPFDRNIEEKIRPLYYGRYVDDMLVVLANNNPLDENNNAISNAEFNFKEYVDFLKNKKLFKNDERKNILREEQLNTTDRYFLRTFYPIFSIICDPLEIKRARLDLVGQTKEETAKSESKKAVKLVYKINEYERLYCQSEKTMFYYFDKSESYLVIEKLKRDLEKRSSEFRNSSDSEEEEAFEKSAFYLLYDGSEGKIRTLKDYQANSYGLAVYLSIKIYNALRSEKRASQEEINKITTFFQGETCLQFYTLWERILTYFAICGQSEEYLTFLISAMEAISNMSSSRYSEGHIPEKIGMDALDYLLNAHDLASSLNMNWLRQENRKKIRIRQLLKKITKNDSQYIDAIENHYNLSYLYRNSNLIRHHYCTQTLVNFTKEQKKLSTNLSSVRLNLNKYNLDTGRLKSSPRPIKYWEICLATMYNALGKLPLPRNINEVKNGTLPFDREKYFEEVYNQYTTANENSFNNKRLPCKLNKGNNSKIDIWELIVNSENLLLKPKIAVANTQVLTENTKNSMRGNPNLDPSRYRTLRKIFELAKNESAKDQSADIVLFPENFLPIELLDRVVHYSVVEQILIVTGLEHLTINNKTYNFVVTILPFESDDIKDAIVVFRLKNHYSPMEELMITGNHFEVPRVNPSSYDLFNWRGIYFSPYYCFELADIVHRSLFKGKIDLLIASEWNPDVNYFSNIVESVSRDLHAYVAQVNTSQYGDTRITKPSKTEKKDILKIKGGINDAVLIDEVDILKLREYQRELFLLNRTDETFKPVPPNFPTEDVLKRINNEPFFNER